MDPLFFVLFEDRLLHLIFFYIVIGFKLIVKDYMELQQACQSMKNERCHNTYMSDQSFHKFVGMPHVRQDQRKVILRCTKEVWAENNGQSLSCHLVVLLIISHSGVASMTCT